MFAAAISMMRSNDLPQQYEAEKTPDILHNSLFSLLNMVLMSLCRLLGRGAVHYASLYLSRCLSLACECNSETYIVHKTNGGCVEQIVLLKQTLFVTIESRQNFSINRAITCILQRLMHPWMACFLHNEDCQVVN